MSKFHDEFFKNGSPEHDKLMMKCLSKNGIDKIGEAISHIDIIDQCYNSENFDADEKHVIVCDHGMGQTANKYDGERQTDTGWIDSWKPCNPEFVLAEDKNKQRKCKKQGSCEHVDTCKWLHDGEKVKAIRIKYLPKIASIETSYETEVIVKNGSFIIGYADAVIKYTVKGTLDAQIKEGWIWQNYDELNFTNVVLLEVKPTLNSIGEVIRQLKTYNSILNRCYDLIMVIATYSKLDQDALNYLANEHISVVTFEQV